MSVIRSGVRVSAAAFALGLSVVGPQAIAAADGGSADNSTGPTSSVSDAPSAAAPQTTRRRAANGAARATAGAAATERSNSGVTAPRSAAATVTGAPRRAAASRSTNRTQTTVDSATTPLQPAPAASAAAPPADVSSRTSAATKSLVGATPSDSTAVDSGDTFNLLGSLELTFGVINDHIDQAIYGFLDAVSNCLSKFPTNPITDFLQGALLTLRRTFFDQTPLLNPVQTTGQSGGEISGTLGGVDPEGETITYSVILAPEEGAVEISSDGTFVYTPGLNFDGSDAFIVSATDKTPTTGLQGNWIDPCRPTNAYAFVEVEQAAQVLTLAAAQQAVAPGDIDFKFSWAEFDAENNPYTEAQAQEAWGGTHYKNSDQYVDMEYSAYALGEDFIPGNGSVTVNIALGVKAGGLASTSGVFTGRTDGFNMTDAQKKIINGTPCAVDATIKLNFINPSFWKNLGTATDTLWRQYPAEWSYFDAELNSDQYNFESVVTHELLHAFGFWDRVSAPTKNTGKEWSTFDQFIGNSNKDRAIDPTTYVWNPTFDKNLVAGNWEDGLYFTGANAMAAFGGKAVPLYSPAEYSAGSSVGHTSDFYFTNRTDSSLRDFIQLMNAKDTAGKWVPVDLSKVELAIMQDLGYTISPTAHVAAATGTSPL